MALLGTRYLDPVTISRLKNIEIKARMIVEGFLMGLHKSPFHGFSVEFAEHRPYNPGEPLRNIDWKIFGKTERLYTKRYEEETNLRCQVILDTSDSMRYPQNGISKLEYGAYLAASLQYLMQLQKDASGLALFDSQITFYHPPRVKPTALLPMLAKLEQVVQEKNVFTHRTATEDVLHQLAQKINRRSVVVLISDLFSQNPNFEALFPALQHLRHQKDEVIIFQLLEFDTEFMFNFPDQPLIIKDLETGEELNVVPQQIRQAYQEQMKSRQQLIRKKCLEYQIDYVEVDIQKPFDRALQEYFIRRQSLIRR
ncbi:MAG: DUF58 domain-containing protein [Bacteroidia bacterium]|nr:DUF58 domain-containing protein [Bacteroidia bacterium]